MIPYDPKTKEGRAEFLAALFNPAGDPNFIPSVQHPGYAAYRQRLAELLKHEPKPE